MRFKFCLLIVLLMSIFVSPLAAQDDGLSEEEQALLDRVLTAVASVRTFSSYSTTATVSETQDLSINIAGIEQVLTSSTTAEIQANLIDPRGENPNVSGTATASFASNENGEEVAYDVEAEFRYVEGVLYINAQYANDTTGPMDLPEGWTVVDSLEGLPEQLDILNLDKVIESVMTGETDDPTDALANLQKVAENASVITSTEEEIDGVAVEAVTITFDWTTMRDAMVEDIGGEDNPIMPVFDQLSGDIGSITVYLDENDQPVGYILNLNIDLQDIDLSAVTSEVPAGTGISMLLTLEQSNMLSNVNGTLEPVTAPE